jgi:hypothetical protein
MKVQKVIVAQYDKDFAFSYEKTREGIPIVIVSNHPRFTVGTRFDWGYVGIACAQGYTVIILPTGKPMTENETEIYGQAEPEKIPLHD